MQPSSFIPPENVCVIEDDEDTASRAPNEEVHSSIKSKRENGSMPSFNLLDEDLEEEELSAKVNEIERKILTEKNIFESIREKAKSLPELVASNVAHSPSTETLKLTRKRSREKQLEYHSEVEVLEELEAENIPTWPVDKPYIELSEEKQSGHNVGIHRTPENHTKAKTSDSSNFMDDTGGLPPDTEEFTFKSFTGETIFDHIRKKAKNFPLLKTLESDPFKQPEFCTDAFNVSTAAKCDDFMGDIILISDLETREVEKDVRGNRMGQKVNHNIYSGSPYQTFGATKVSPRVSSTDIADLSSIKMLSFDISMLKNSKGESDPCITFESRRKQQHSPSVQQKQCFTLATAGKAREAESFLGFETVFSFL